MACVRESWPLWSGPRVEAWTDSATTQAHIHGLDWLIPTFILSVTYCETIATGPP